MCANDLKFCTKISGLNLHQKVHLFSPIMSKNLSGVPLESLMKYDFEQYCHTFAYQNDSPYNGKEQVFVITLRINSATFVKLMRLFFSSC
jgi:hypothetical protein